MQKLFYCTVTDKHSPIIPIHRYTTVPHHRSRSITLPHRILHDKINLNTLKAI
jgi:hypothetical protein